MYNLRLLTLYYFTMFDILPTSRRYRHEIMMTYLKMRNCYGTTAGYNHSCRDYFSLFVGKLYLGMSGVCASYNST